jgi:hypothetical protein
MSDFYMQVVAAVDAKEIYHLPLWVPPSVMIVYAGIRKTLELFRPPYRCDDKRYFAMHVVNM